MNGRSKATKPICSDFSTACAESGGEKSLQPIDPAATVGGMAAVVQPVADPREPLHLDRAANRMWTARTILAVARTGRGARRPRAGLAVYIAARFRRRRLRLLGHFAARAVAIRAAAGDCRLRRRRAGGVSGAGLDRRHGSGAGAVDGFLQRRRRRAAQRAHAVFDRPRAGPRPLAAAARAPRGAEFRAASSARGSLRSP